MSIEFSTINCICCIFQPNRNDIMYMRYVRRKIGLLLQESFTSFLLQDIAKSCKLSSPETQVEHIRQILTVIVELMALNIYYLIEKLHLLHCSICSIQLIFNNVTGVDKKNSKRIIFYYLLNSLHMFGNLNKSFYFSKIKVMMMTRKITVVRFQ